MSTTDSGTAVSPSPAWPRWVAAIGVALLFFRFVGLLNYADPDMWHQMALVRDAWRLGAMPRQDLYSYTGSKDPVLDHEWLTGAVLLGVGWLGGATALITVKYLAAAAIAATAVVAAWRRGAPASVMLALAPVAILMGAVGFTTIRAQVFTLLFTAILLLLLERDRHGDRRWAWVWLPLFVVWNNMHGGSLLGIGLFGLHLVEQLLHRQPVRRLFVVAAALALLCLVNPYGWDYMLGAVGGARVHRPQMLEWQPLWASPLPIYHQTMYLVAIALVAVAWRRLGWSRMPGLFAVLATALLAASGIRHLSIFALVWFVMAPAWVAASRPGESIERLWRGFQTPLAVMALVIGVAAGVAFVNQECFRLRIPVSLAEQQQGLTTFPTGAFDYLRRQGFKGKLLLPFNEGSYATWVFGPHVRISYDGRYELVYSPELLDEHMAFYKAAPNGEELLRRHPPDCILVPCTKPILQRLTARSDFRIVYHDQSYAVFARAGKPWPTEIDANKMPPPATFP